MQLLKIAERILPFYNRLKSTSTCCFRISGKQLKGAKLCGRERGANAPRQLRPVVSERRADERVGGSVDRRWKLQSTEVEDGDGQRTTITRPARSLLDGCDER